MIVGFIARSSNSVVGTGKSRTGMDAVFTIQRFYLKLGIRIKKSTPETVTMPKLA